MVNNYLGREALECVHAIVKSPQAGQFIWVTASHPFLVAAGFPEDRSSGANDILAPPDSIRIPADLEALKVSSQALPLKFPLAVKLNEWLRTC